VKTVCCILFILISCFSEQVIAQYSQEQKKEIDSLTQLLNIAEEDTTKIDLRFLIGETGWIFRTSYWDSISNDCIKLLAKPTISLQEKKFYRNSLAVTFNNTGFIYNNQGDISKALLYFHRSLKLYENQKNEKGIAEASNNIGLIYHDQENIPMALKYYHKALKLREKIGDKRGIANSLNNIGFIYKSQKNTPMAILYLERSLNIYKEIGDKQGIASSSNSIGVILQRQGDIDSAVVFHKQALIIQEEIGDKDGIAHSVNNLSEIALANGEVKLAETYANRALKISKELGFPSPMSEASKLLSAISKKEGKYKKGWEHFEIYIKMRDSIRNQETEKTVLEQEMRYEYEKMALKDSLEDAQIQAVKDIQIKEQKATIKQEQTQKYALIGGLILMIVLIVIGIKAYQQKKKDNLLINEQKQQVEEKNKEITDSITYAKRIQDAILPPKSELNKHLKDGFVLYKPKDIVAGDFYWLEVIDDLVLYAAADCTGHGVPGAMVSVVCHGALNRAVREFNLLQPDLILNKVRELVLETFRTENQSHNKNIDDIADGMDIALCSLNHKTKMLNFSGANNSINIISGGKINVIKADKQPIGKYIAGKPFTNHQIQLKKEDLIYIFTDGYPDQFGGSKCKKYKYEPLRKLLLSIRDKEMDIQKQILDREFNNWKGALEQVDDVCVIGVRI
jgi:serine phosphatase RsbU (regulator of sigma subunit)/Tfp pilus assembly protein PilF